MKAISVWLCGLFLLTTVIVDSVLRVMTLNINNIQSPEKYQLLSQTLHSLTIDIALLQEVSSPNILHITGYTAEINTDYKTRGTAILLKNHIQYNTVKMTSDFRGISLIVNDVTFINVYAPSGTNKRKEREHFFAAETTLLLNTTSHLVMGGDFNTVLSSKDQTGHCAPSPALKHLVCNLQLRDTWDAAHPNQTIYTFQRNGTGSRLDRIYISKNLQLRTVAICPTVISDHCGYVASLVMPLDSPPHGRGYWQLNASILRDQELNSLFTTRWKQWRQHKQYYDSKLEWWLSMKSKIKSLFQQYSWRKRELKQEYRNFLYTVLHELYNKPTTSSEQSNTIRQVKAKLTKIQLEDVRGHQVRAKLPHIPDERVSTLHIITERKRGQRKYIHRLQEPNGKVIHTQLEIRTAFHNYFSALYCSPNIKLVDTNNHDSLGIPPHVAFTIDEVHAALTLCPHRKSPGEDGLNVEFYQHFWEVIKDDLTDVYNEILHCDSVPSEFTNGIMVMIPKIPKPKTVADYRPITLLNCDYKIFMRSLKKRIHPEVDNILSTAQQCVRSNGNILHALCAIRDAISDAHHPRQSKILLSLDFDHAFDRVDHNYLFQTMRRFDIPVQYIITLQKIMRTAQSRILINGYFTPSVQIQRSVRQGCPLSMHLFVLSLEPLLRQIQTYIQPHPHSFVRAYADDVTMVLSPASNLQRIYDIITSYCLTSGAKLNTLKTKAITIGSVCIHAPHWFTLTTDVKILGIYFSSIMTQMVKFNWTRIINIIRQQLFDHRHRMLNLIQRIHYVNLYALSKVWYTSQVLPLPQMYGYKLKSVTGWFIWAGHMLRIRRDNLALPYSQGGLQAIDPQLKADSLFFKQNWQHLTQKGDPYSYYFLSKWLPDYRTMNPPDFRRLPKQAPQLQKLIQCVSYSNLLRTPHPLTTRAIYTEKIQQLPLPTVMIRNPIYNWRRIWANLHNKKLPTQHKSLWFQIIHDIYPTAEHLHRLKIKTTAMCEHCGKTDTVTHRFDQCINSQLWMSTRANILQLIDKQQATFGTRYIQWPTFKFRPPNIHTAVILELGQGIWRIMEQ